MTDWHDADAARGRSRSPRSSCRLSGGRQVPFFPGGSAVVTGKLSAMWHQPVTLDNRPGAGSTAAPTFVAKSPADGYTLLVNSSAQAYSAALKNLPYAH
jgi:tripartite-type tricarboxylate transporter receptor subunit TctC